MHNCEEGKQKETFDNYCRKSHVADNFAHLQSELPRQFPRNSVESDHGCKSRIYFDNAGDNVTLTLYNVTLTSQKLC